MSDYKIVCQLYFPLICQLDVNNSSYLNSTQPGYLLSRLIYMASSKIKINPRSILLMRHLD